MMHHSPIASPRLLAASQQASHTAAQWVRTLREQDDNSLIEAFLAEYGLSSDEGVALMCLAEAMLRVPDAPTIDALIKDKIAPSRWAKHLGQSGSHLVNASTWALMLTGRVLDDDSVVPLLSRLAQRLGEPLIRVAVQQAMAQMGAQFVLGEDIQQAIARCSSAYRYSFDMLGEAAMTAADADGYLQAYHAAIAEIATHCNGSITDNPGISIKLSALHPRYETLQRQRVMDELVPRVLALAQAAKAGHMGLNIDAEEAERLELSQAVIEAVLSHPSLADWEGFGIVVQAYGQRAEAMIDWFDALAERLQRRVMLRLVKGAYWDREIKRAQVEGLPHYPVYTSKSDTDQAYLRCAEKLLSRRERIYPQFATHNAHTLACVMELAGDNQGFELQRLHGMGEALHAMVAQHSAMPCRVYAPVGTHRDLLAYLVRRLLENGANSSFVHQIVDAHIAPEDVAANPFTHTAGHTPRRSLPAPSELYAPERRNSRGWDLYEPSGWIAFDQARAPWKTTTWQASALLALPSESRQAAPVFNPAQPDELVGHLTMASLDQVALAKQGAQPWGASVDERAQVLRRAAELYEAQHGELFALLTREAGKTALDSVSELREAVDFLRYYAARAPYLAHPARGVFTCISPWNFPLAIFTGQIAAALAAGNAVLAKPAEASSLIAYAATSLLHQAGVPRSALQLLPGLGSEVGAALCEEADGVCFTGSTATAQAIHGTLRNPLAPLIAETGGLNAMIVDSTALLEQAVRDIVASAFQSAGQRCSALRCLYVQADIKDALLRMLFGAMDELIVGDPWQAHTDLGPVISAQAQQQIHDYLSTQTVLKQTVLKQTNASTSGHFVAPCVVEVSGIEALGSEVFGPVLHVASFQAEQLDTVLDAINASGYGLTFGLHSRIDSRIEYVRQRLHVGNLYINRNQIGAVVGSQPFGGEGLSGTGPKAGGPHYLPRFSCPPRHQLQADSQASEAPAAVQTRINAARTDAAHAGVSNQALAQTALPGPTGESNILYQYGRGVVLCLGPTRTACEQQARRVKNHGCIPVIASIDAGALQTLEGFDLVVSWAEHETLASLRHALSQRQGKIIALCSDSDLSAHCRIERHCCIDTTAAGGNASLLAG